jgi:hypothetical protein
VAKSTTRKTAKPAVKTTAKRGSTTRKTSKKTTAKAPAVRSRGARATRADDAYAASVVPFTNDAATAQDAARAAQLPPAAKTPVSRVTSAFVDLLGGPGLQASLRQIEGDLKGFGAFEGQDVGSALAMAAEGKELTYVADRLANSAERVRQRVVAINAQLRAFETALARVAGQAKKDSAVAKALTGLVTQRLSARGDTKRRRAQGQKRRAKTPAA